ncbi:MAG: TNT domain-containing protein [Hydrogenophaga sp.]|uniref:glycohydrolase toxin TNT-related protein n=1 Tax=Hydrogenophaga sp. TaxID=1904254 RepID=UPI00262EE32E|nr:glycohydrolase toxin TNT-related protein [Hydrogenophaga sp.]MCV0438422.1 TNT domain-containing protein [Hydrogenophaga sp.]
MSQAAGSGASRRRVGLSQASSSQLGEGWIPESTNFAVRDEYIVLKPFKVEESRVMPWFGQQGMGIQYETSKGVEKNHTKTP